MAVNVLTAYTNPTIYDVRQNLVLPPAQTPVVKSPCWFYDQPDDGPLTRPKHVVVYYIVLISDKLLCFWLHVYIYIYIYTIYTLCY